MHTISVAAASVRFPDACVECGGAPERTYALHVTKGIAPFAVPLCARCSELKMTRRIGWIIGCLVLGAVIIVGGAIASEAVLPLATARTLVGPIVLGLFAIGAIPVWLGLRRKAAAFHRRFSAVAVNDLRGNDIVLAFREPALAATVEALSRGEAPAHPFRPAAAAAVHDGKHRPIAPFVIVIIAAVVMIGVGISEAASVGPGKDAFWVEWIAYSIAGRAGVFAIFAFGALVLGAVGVAGLLRIRRSSSPGCSSTQ